MSQPEPAPHPRRTRIAGAAVAVHRYLGLLFVLGVLATASTDSALSQELALSVGLERANTPEFFEEHVAPLLRRNCFACHGPLRQRGNLRLDSRQAMLLGGETGSAILPGSAAESLLFKAVLRGGELLMPPPGPLDPEQIAILEAWIDAGAIWPEGADSNAPTEILRVAAREVPLVAAPLEPGAPLRFDQHVRPILAKHCYECHGPDQRAREAGLRLDTEEGAKGLLESGRRALVPGDLERSQLFQRIAAVRTEDRMPPQGGAEHGLSAQEIDTLGRFILQGATWQSHWALMPPQRPEPPQTSSNWARNEIDLFVGARLEAEGLAPSPGADRRTLARRLTLDLTGLPPTPEGVESFVADTDPQAYENLVDRLLSSPRYGEHAARYWLDAARYADTNGYHIDNERFMWRWREWVIDAFNDNQPFDRFTIEQLAGDLLPNPTLSQQIATGFHRNHMINFEGGAIPEEYRTQYVFDRVDTTATVWLGMTVECAKCHDHKFDPISQREYYQLAAFFNSVEEEGLDGSTGNAKPLVAAPDSEQSLAERQLLDELAPLYDLLDLPHPEADSGMRSWRGEWADRTRKKWQPIEPTEITALSAAYFERQPDGSALVLGESLDTDTFEVTSGLEGRDIRALRLEALRDERLPKGGIGRSTDDGSFMLTDLDLELALPGRGFEPIELSGAMADHAHPFAPVGLAIDEDEASGWSADYSGNETQRTAVFLTKEPLTAPPGSRLRVRLHHQSVYPQRVVGRFRLSVTSSEDVIAQYAAMQKAAEDEDEPPTTYSRSDELAVAVPFALDALLATRDEELTPEQADRVRRHFRRNHWPQFVAESERFQKLEQELAALREQIPTTMVMAERPEMRPTFVLLRGQYDLHGEQVQADTPAMLPPLRTSAESPSRLDLARWLVSPEHPLTARVTVNRFWQRFFGHGLVKTGGDFGTQGELASHPELLDWLATEFVASGWDMKFLQRLIVGSATYRQSSKVSPELLKLDPENRFLARASRFRLDAEVLRDSALAYGGLLEQKLGGPGVNPYQPAGLWKEIGYESRGRFSAGEFVQGSGEDLYRRSLYTFWKRTVPPPNMLVFDAPNRETCTVKRGISNTPLQALTLLNDPQFVEAARALAQRLLKVHPDNSAARIDEAFEIVLGRAPRPSELETLGRLVREQMEYFRVRPEAATELLEVGDSPPPTDLDPAELAAWSLVASVVLNLDETLTRL